MCFTLVAVTLDPNYRLLDGVDMSFSEIDLIHYLRVYSMLWSNSSVPVSSLFLSTFVGFFQWQFLYSILHANNRHVHMNSAISIRSSIAYIMDSACGRIQHMA